MPDFNLAIPKDWASIIAWTGLAIFALAFVAVMVTRWGQAKPLSKCIGLSVLAHFLLMAYAYGTRMLLSEPAAPPEPKPFRLVSVEQFDPTDDPLLQDNEQKPWEELLTDAAMQPADFELTPQEIRPTESVMPTFSTSAPSLLRAPETDVALELPEFDRPEAASNAPDALRETEPSPAAVAIASTPKKQETDPTDSPLGPLEVSAPERMTSVSGNAVDALEPPPFESPTDIAQPIKDVTIADAAIDREIADLLAGPRDNFDPAAAIGSAGSDLAASSSQASRSQPQHDNPTIDMALRSSPRRLGDGQPLPDPYRLRGVDTRLAAAEQFGGSKETEQAVDSSLKWLAENQRIDGRWSSAAHGGGREDRVLGHNRNSAGARADSGVTGLALLAFLGAGHTHLEGPYRENVRRALEFLAGVQKSDGNLAGNASFFAHTYCHGMATLAFSEAYAMTGDPRLKGYAEKAIQYTLNLQDETTGGWRYRKGEKGDMSQFGWQVMALRSAELAGINVPTKSQEGMRSFLDSCSSGAHKGLGSYRENERPSSPMTAEALTCRYFLRETMKDEQKKEAAGFINRERPGMGKPNFYYWYYGTLALYMQQGPEWEAWNDALQAELLSSQQKSGPAAGSWKADSVWGGYGGRVFTTAMATLSLEVYYRYLPVYRQ